MSADQLPTQPDPHGPAFDVSPSAICGSCGSEITTEYYEVNGQVACEDCRIAAEEAQHARGAGRFMRAVLLGLLASAAGFGIYYAVARFTGKEYAIIAALIGIMVGLAVKRGSGGRGGWRYQTLAVLLTYATIVSSYVPFIVEEVLKDAQAPATAAATPLDTAASLIATGAAPPLGMLDMILGLIAMTAFVFAVPFLAGMENVLGLVIIAVGLYEAWYLNRRSTLAISGPFKVTDGV